MSSVDGPNQQPSDGSPQEAEGHRQTRFVAPDGATTILLLRHGASEPAHPDRPFPLVDGHGDPALDPVGHEQAAAAAARLQHERIDAIYVTSLRRTAQTAAPLAKALGLTPIVEPDLREVHLGEWEGGLVRAKAAAMDPIFLRMHVEERWDVIPGAESNERIEARTGAAIQRIVAAHPGGRVVAVVHGGIIAHLVHRASGSRPFAFAGADNCSISELCVVDGQMTMRRFNDTAHLDPPYLDRRHLDAPHLDAPGFGAP